MSVPFMSQSAFLRTMANRVKSLRLSREWTQAELAARAGIALPTYRAFERSGRIALERVYRIAVAFGRAGELAELFKPAPAKSIEELVQPSIRKRGRRKTTARKPPVPRNQPPPNQSDSGDQRWN